ncbi:hypothetical protein GGQ74_001666 [Desulfobaculum xiamenense]|uniref:MetA-pathway of phenol degradation n=1 Tax=Desulfobaculum xiamenense TaxID=995050 RepID=A0A846QNY3_9BACT|nr:transporter [Desulfobaculum xiamenense]NJB67993.1 hypothetical protein [Desulfobaculum xiamenense]
MKLGRILSLALVTVLLSGVAALAGDAAPAPKAVPPVTGVFGPCGTGFPVGKFAAVANYAWKEADHVRHYSDKINDNIKVDKSVVLAKTRYGIAPGLDIRTCTPIYNVDLDTPAGDKSQHGWGDTTAVLHKILMNQGQGDVINLALDMGVVLPTGSLDKQSNDFIGNGAWGLLGGVGATYFYGANRFDTEVNYTTFWEGGHDYTHPDRMRWNAGWAYALSANFDLGVESNFEWNDESQKFGERMNDSSVEWYVGPKVTFKYAPMGLICGGAVTMPVYRWYENVKPGSDDYRVEFKFIKTFDLGSMFN